MKSKNNLNIKSKKKLIIGIICVSIIIACTLIYIFLTMKPDIEVIKDSVVMIETFDDENNLIGTGSGFCVYKDNYIVTNYHVIKGAKTIKIIDDNNKKYNVKKIEIMKNSYDLAILSGDYSFTPLKIGNSKLKVGENVTCIGSPQGELNTVSTGIISNVDDDYEIRITAPISPGSSGGVLLNNNYEVIGITYATYDSLQAQNINYAINVKYLYELNERLINKDYDILNENNNESKFTLEDIGKFDINDSYYYTDDFSMFNNLTSTKKIFEKELNEKYSDWYNIYNQFSDSQKKQCISILESLPREKLIFEIQNNLKEYDFSEIAYNIVVKRWQYAIITTKINTLNDSIEVEKVINSLPISNGQKMLLKYCCLYHNIYYFSDDENKAIIDYLLKTKNTSINEKVAITLLEKMGYRVEKEGDTYEVHWN